MLIILLWMLPMPFLVATFKNDGAVLSTETLPDVLRTQLMLAQGRIISVGDLYGPQVTRENFNPGPGFYRHFDDNRRSASDGALEIFREPENSDLSMYDVRFDYIKSAYAASKTQKLILITGDPQTGKTRTLRQIEMMMGDLASPVLTIYVDLPVVFTSNAADRITVEDILRGAVQEDYVDLVENIIEVNPSKIKIFLDGIDQVPQNVQEKILSTIAEFNGRGINVMMTSSTEISPALTARQMSPSTFYIPSTLSNDQFEQLMTRYWDEQLSSENPSKRRLREYSKTMRILIEETPLPRSAGLARILAEYALNRNLLMPFPTIKMYLEQPKKFSGPNKLIQLSNQMRIHKIYLYDRVLGHFVPMMKAYGPQALSMIFKSKSTGIGIELATAVRSSNEFITKSGKHAFPLLKFADGVPVDFIHEEYKRYFAAKYIMDHFAKDIQLSASFKEILTNQEHIFVLEFVDSAIKGSTIHTNKITTKILSEMAASKFADTVLDNLIQHRLDNLCSALFKISNAENIKSYLNGEKILQSKNKYSFGMLSDVRDIDRRYYLPRKTPWPFISGSRVEMIVSLDMKHTRMAAERSGFQVDPNIQLIHEAKQSAQRFERFLKKNGQGPYPADVLNTAMYESLDSLGKDSFQILVKLQALGAEPANAKKNGRTLAHVAAQYHDWELLSMVHEDFGVPLVDIADGNGRTILIELLEFGMPSNSYTAEGAWEAMLYLAEKADLSFNRDLIERSSEDLLEFSPKIQEIPDAYQKLLTSESESSAIREVLKKYIRLRDIDLPPGVSSTRRKLLLQNCIRKMNEKISFTNIIHKRLKMTNFVTLSDLVLSHYDVVGTSDFNVYKKTIKILLGKELTLVNDLQISRIFKLIAINTMSTAELLAMGNMIDTLVQSHGNRAFTLDMNTIFTRRIQEQLPINAGGKFEDLIVRTVYDLKPQIKFNMPEAEGREIFANENHNDPSVEASCMQFLA